MSASPIRDAFATVWRTPSLWLAEVAWRWAFGATAWVLVLLTFGTWLDSLPVSRVDRVLLASGSPDLMGQALRHIFAGSTAVLLRGAAVLLPGLVLLWTVSASVGRAAILRTLMPASDAHWRSLLGVSFLRAMITVAAKVCGLAALIIFVRVATPALPAEGRPEVATLLFLLLMMAIGVCWWVMNAFIAVAPIYAGQRLSTSGPLATTFENARMYTGKWLGIASGFAALHVGVFVVFSMTVPAILSMAGTAPRAFSLSAVVVVTLAYFALVDAISVLRLAAYAGIAEPMVRRAEERTVSVVVVVS